MSEESKQHLDIKITLLGGAKTGKTTLVNFLKEDNSAEEYHETWEVKINILEWQPQFKTIKSAVSSIRFMLWENGSSFLKKFSLYNDSLLKGCNILLYVFSFLQLLKVEQVEELVLKTRK